MDGTTGKLRWHAEPLTGDGYADAIADGGDLLYAASGTDLLAYRKSDGSLAWQAQMPDKLNYGDIPLLVTGGMGDHHQRGPIPPGIRRPHRQPGLEPAAGGLMTAPCG